MFLNHTLYQAYDYVEAAVSTSKLLRPKKNPHIGDGSHEPSINNTKAARSITSPRCVANHPSLELAYNPNTYSLHTASSIMMPFIFTPIPTFFLSYLPTFYPEPTVFILFNTFFINVHPKTFNATPSLYFRQSYAHTSQSTYQHLQNLKPKQSIPPSCLL